MLMSHSATLPFEIHEEDPEWWNEYITTISNKHSEYFKILLGDSIEKEKSPIFFTRFEDLLSQPEKELTGLFKYLLDMDNLSGTNIERRIKMVVGMGAKGNTTYVLKKTTG